MRLLRVRLAAVGGRQLYRESCPGDVRIERSGSSVPLLVGDPVQEKDRIVVSTDDSAGITLRDDTRISVGPNSTLVINGFAFDPKTREGRVETSILRGTMCGT